MALEKNKLENTNQYLNTHPLEDCQNDGPCTIHRRSSHHMRNYPQSWRGDRGIMERICNHGIGHPDPDDVTSDRIHGCDGCCYAPTDEEGTRKNLQEIIAQVIDDHSEHPNLRWPTNPPKIPCKKAGCYKGFPHDISEEITEAVTNYYKEHGIGISL